jgi:hypothetical protein
VSDGLKEGVTLGVTEPVGVKEGVTDGVPDFVGVIEPL